MKASSMVSSDRVSDRRFGIAAWALSMVIPCGMVALHDGFRNRAWAQVTPDGTLGTQLDPNLVITGGTQVNTNLFHSFSSFSVPPGQTAEFVNDPAIVNIFGRVTGGTPSNILGTIRSQSPANIFLINPNGIIFGPNARLDIGGSFVGTTANAVRFGDGGEFSMTSAVTPGDSLLAVNPSTLFFNQTPAGAIVNQSRVSNPIDPNTVDGLRVPDGRSLLLVGGDVKIEGGIMQALGGRIELGGLAAPGEIEVGFIRDNILGLSFPEGATKADISLTNNAEISASIFSGGGNDAGIVILRGNNVSIDDSRIFSQISAGGQGSAGGILIEASSLSLSNNAGITSSSLSSGNAGAIVIKVDGSASFDRSLIQSNLENGATNSFGGLVSITAESLSLLNGSQVQTIVRGNENGKPAGQGDAGRIFIDVNDTVTIDGVGVVNGETVSSAISSRIGSGSSGKAGDIQINTRALSLSNSGFIDTTLVGFGTAGSIFIEAKDSVSLASGAEIRSAIEEGATQSGDASYPFGNIFGVLSGKGGEITGTILISTGTLSLTDGAVLNTSTFGSGNAGAVVVVARDDVSLKGGVIGSVVGKQATGDAGAILMSVGSLSIASTPIYDAGLTTETVAGGVGDAGLVYVEAEKDISIRGGYIGRESGIASRVEEGSTNRSGAIYLEARSLFLRGEGAKVTVNNKGSGFAGDIEAIMREDIILRDKGEISAIAASGQGGNIFLTSGDFLVLVNGSQVSTKAGEGIGGGNGGNVFVDTRYIIAAPFNDNNISAEAFAGDGGRIAFNANRLYDIEARDFPSLRTNDIAASSDFGVDGTVSGNVLNLDPTQGLANLPANPVDPSTLIAETCAPRSGVDRPTNQFINTERGGLPPDPNAAFTGEAGVNDLSIPETGETNTTDDSSSIKPTHPDPVATTSPQNSERIEAQGWVYGENGDIIFTAQAPTLTPTTPVLAPASTCNDLSQLPQ